MLDYSFDLQKDRIYNVNFNHPNLKDLKSHDI